MNRSGGYQARFITFCDALGHKNPRQATADHCKPEGVRTTDTLMQGVIQKVIIINEANLNRLMMQSNVEQAIQFQDWVCEEFLPSIPESVSCLVLILSPADALTTCVTRIHTVPKCKVFKQSVLGMGQVLARLSAGPGIVTGYIKI